MSTQVLLQILVAVASAIFGAGVAWGAMRAQGAAVRKDVNALGAIVRRDRWNLMMSLFVILEKREDRQRLADLMRQQ
ncbi:MAG: hypothetical protein ACRD4S_17035 [Candidatus Acidiferrales bacterium]